ncbi:MAG: pilus assembly protein TadG-related protein [Actinobacteria bacterium]|nr:pilus assembly protein TadG-related protein [Actinomycetota bacterium]MDA2995719.1 pilus assembly protein TadG-related protein [Actinomycetota bacterium]
MNHNTSALHHSDKGSISVLFAIAALPMLAITAVVADVGMVHAKRQELQTGVEASAIAGAAKLTAGSPACSGYTENISANLTSLSPIATQCSISGTSNSVVTISAEASTPLAFSQLLGKTEASISSTASVKVGASRSAMGLRPLAICADHPALEEWLSTGMMSTTYTIFVESDGASCSGSVPGNWSMIDFDGGSNSNSELQDRIVNGYQSEIVLPVTLNGDPGIPTPSIDIDLLIGDTITIPVFSAARSNGASSEYDLDGLVAIEVVDVVMTGAAAQRHVDVRFIKRTLGEGLAGGPVTNYGSQSFQICSLEGKGNCS